MKKIIWVLINCNSVREADKIGKAVLEKRLASCYDIIPRVKTAYFWPPKSGKLETAKGVTLAVETFTNKFSKIVTHIKKLHSDILPFIGSITIDNVSEEYYKWMKDEIR